MPNSPCTPQDQVSRRTFLHTGSATVGVTLAGTGLPAGAQAPARGKVPLRTLGRTGQRVSILGIGAAPLQRDPVTHKTIETLLERAYALGVNYFDIAPNYGNAEEKVGPVLKSVRDRFFLVTKCEEPTYNGAWKLLRQSLKRLQTDRIDVLHLHNFGNKERFPDLDVVFGKQGAMQCLREAKERGIIRFIGATGHLYPWRFRWAIDSGEIDVIMNAVNFIVRHTYDFEGKSFARARAKNIGLVAMKVLGGQQGQSGFRVPREHYRSAIRYAMSLPGVSTALVGMQNVDELNEAAAVALDFKPLAGNERERLLADGARLAKTERWAEAYGKPLT